MQKTDYRKTINGRRFGPVDPNFTKLQRHSLRTQNFTKFQKDLHYGPKLIHFSRHIVETFFSRILFSRIQLMPRQREEQQAQQTTARPPIAAIALLDDVWLGGGTASIKVLVKYDRMLHWGCALDAFFNYIIRSSHRWHSLRTLC